MVRHAFFLVDQNCATSCLKLPKEFQNDAAGRDDSYYCDTHYDTLEIKIGPLPPRLFGHFGSHFAILARIWSFARVVQFWLAFGSFGRFCSCSAYLGHAWPFRFFHDQDFDDFSLRDNSIY